MDFIKNLFLHNQTNPTVNVDQKEHIFRSYHAKEEFVSTPIHPKLSKNDCTISKIWEETVKKNGLKPVFGSRPLIKVSFFYTLFKKKKKDYLPNIFV